MVSKDTDGDGIPDWEERLYGLDPTKAETTPGVPDAVAIEKLRTADNSPANVDQTGNGAGPDNSTSTSKFSQELFSTVAALSQSGSLDQSTSEQITNSLTNNIQNIPQQKVYTTADITISNNTTVKKYDAAMDALNTKYPVKGNVMAIFQKFLGDGTNLDENALLELTPIINQTQNLINGVVKVPVPPSLADLHLAALNAMEKLKENLSNITLYSTDPIVSLGALSQYENTVSELSNAILNLKSMIAQKLNS